MASCGLICQSIGREKAAADSSAMIDRAIQQVRSMSHLLHPPLLDEVGLCSALEQYLEGFTKRSGIQTIVQLPPRDSRASNRSWRPLSSASFKKR